MPTTPDTTAEDRLRGEIKAQMARTQPKSHTAETLAPLVGMSAWALRRRLSGEVALKFGEVEAIADALGVEVEDLIARGRTTAA